MVSLKAAKLTAEHQELWRRFLDAKERAKGLSKADEERKKLQAELLEAFGSDMLARLPDGTILQRTQKTREVAAKEACSQSWWELGVLVGA